MRRVLRRKLWDLCIYLVFLMCFTFSAVVVTQNQDAFWLGSNPLELLVSTEFLPSDVPNGRKTFKDIRNIYDFHSFLRGPFYNGLWGDGSMYGDPDSAFPGYVMGVNKILGGVRISQMRVSRDPSACYDSYRKYGFVNASARLPCMGAAASFDLDEEAREPFGDLEPQWRWEGQDGEVALTSPDEERGKVFGQYRLNHDRWIEAGAYYVVLPPANATAAWEKLEHIIEGRYIDRQTRAVVIDFTLYNANLDLFSCVNIAVEQSRGGGLVPSRDFFTARMFTFFESRETLWVALEFVVALFFLYFILQEGRKGYFFGWAHFLQLHIILHCINLCIYLCMWGMRIVAKLSLPDAGDVQLDGDQYYNLRVAAAMKVFAVNLTSINIFATWFKAVSYLAYIPRFGLVTGTLARSATAVGAFLVVFGVVYYGFSAAHMMTFGGKIYGFRNMTASVFTLLKALLGEFDFEELKNASWFFGPLFFVMFIGLAVFVVLNLLIAIISDAYGEQDEFIRQQVSSSYGRRLMREMSGIFGNILSRIPLLGPSTAWVSDRVKAKRELAQGKKLRAMRFQPHIFTHQSSSQAAEATEAAGAAGAAEAAAGRGTTLANAPPPNVGTGAAKASPGPAKASPAPALGSTSTAEVRSVISEAYAAADAAAAKGGRELFPAAGCCAGGCCARRDRERSADELQDREQDLTFAVSAEDATCCTRFCGLLDCCFPPPIWGELDSDPVSEDPRFAGGAFQTKLTEEINTRVALKVRVVGGRKGGMFGGTAAANLDGQPVKMAATRWVYLARGFQSTEEVVQQAERARRAAQQEGVQLGGAHSVASSEQGRPSDAAHDDEGGDGLAATPPSLSSAAEEAEAGGAGLPLRRASSSGLIERQRSPSPGDGGAIHRRASAGVAMRLAKSHGHMLADGGRVRDADFSPSWAPAPAQGVSRASKVDEGTWSAARE